MFGVRMQKIPLEQKDAYVFLRVRLTPGASHTGLTGLYIGADDRPSLKAGVTAVPEKGKANKALIRLLSKEWKLPRSAFQIVSGETDRNKVLRIDADYSHIAGLLAPFCTE